MTSEKRASSPALITAASALSQVDKDAPPPSKARRLNGTSTAGPRRAVEMSGVWTMYIDNLLDTEDFGEALLSMESLISRLHIPIKSHIHQLVALALSPSSCTRAVKKSSDGKRAESKLKPSTVDPFPATERKARLLALRLLEDIAATLGGDAVFRALRGHGVDELLAQDDGKQGEESEEEDEVDDEDGPLVLAGKRVGTCEDVWALLGGGAGKRPTSHTEDQPMAAGAWEVLRSFVGIWEQEASKRAEGPGEDLPVSPSLLRALKANISGIREVSKGKGPLAIIAWPFRAAEEASESGEEDENEDEDMEERDERKDRKLPVDHDDLTIAEKQSVAMRLLALLAQAVAAGRLDSSSLLSETSMCLKELSSESFATFVERLPLSTPHFTVRLCIFYLEKYSLATPSPPNASPTASPSRRRTLGASGSVSSVSNGSRSRAVLPSSREILSLLAKLPSIFPPPPDDSAASSSLAPTTKHRTPKRDPPTFAKIAEACTEHSLMKQVLLEGVWGTLGAEQERRTEKERLEETLLVDGEAGRVLREVEEKVEEARKRIEGV